MFHEFDGGAASVALYGERRTELGVGLDLVDPDSGEVTAFGGEQLQVRNGQIEGTLVLRDPETFEDVTLTITTAEGEWSGTWPATLRTRATVPPRAL